MPKVMRQAIVWLIQVPKSEKDIIGFPTFLNSKKKNLRERERGLDDKMFISSSASPAWPIW